jgi:hypothetical protein
MQVITGYQLLFAPGKKRKGLSADCGEILQLPFAHLLVKAADGVLLEMRSLAMVVQCSGIGILLIDHYNAGISFHKVSNVADAPRLLARGVRQLL